MQFEDELAAQLASATLVRFARIGEPVAQHEMAGFQCRLNHFFYMLCPRGKHQCQFCSRREAACRGVEQYIAYLFPDGSSTRLARAGETYIFGAKDSGKFLQLRALARSIQPFECNEFAAPGHAT